MYRLTVARGDTIEWNTPRSSRCLVSLAKKPSTAFIQDADVGVKWKRKSRVAAEPFDYLGVLVGGVVVQDQTPELNRSGKSWRPDTREKLLCR